MQKVKVYVNKDGKRRLTKAILLKENKKTIIVKLKGGNIVKRHKTKDLIKEDNNG